MTNLCSEELEILKEDITTDNFIMNKYLDTWDYDDNYSHNEIEVSRDQFVEEANKFFEENKLTYRMREICENAMVCDINTDEILNDYE